MFQAYPTDLHFYLYGTDILKTTVAFKQIIFIAAKYTTWNLPFQPFSSAYTSGIKNSVLCNHLHNSTPKLFLPPKHSKFWNREDISEMNCSPTQDLVLFRCSLFSRLFWLFKIFCISTLILELVCQFLQETAELFVVPRSVDQFRQ